MWFCEPTAPRWRCEACSCAKKKPVTKNKGRRNTSSCVFQQKNNKCRNPSHACTPRRNPSPPLRPVTLACAHVPTDKHQIWAVLRVLRLRSSSPATGVIWALRAQSSTKFRKWVPEASRPRRDEYVDEVERGKKKRLRGRFEYFYFFSARGRGRGSPRRQEGAGVGFLLKIPGGRGGSPTRGGGGEGGRVSAGNFGGGAKYFFSGPKCPPRLSPKCQKIVNVGLFLDFFDPRGREAPGTHFRICFGLWARRAQITPVAGEEDRNS